MRLRLYTLLTVLFLTSSCVASRASHFLGGELAYVALPNGQYEIIGHMYQDCLNGSQGAIDQDAPFILAVFSANGMMVAINREIPISTTQAVPAGALPGCLRSSTNLCVRLTEFRWTVTLPASTTPYTVVYDRCCAPTQVSNVYQPGQSGMALRAVIPPTPTSSGSNSSPVFRALPTQRVCVGQPFSIDVGTTDVDGDVIAHTLITPLRATASNADPKPNTPNATALGPILFTPPYSATAPAGPSNPLTLNSTTGMLSGTISTVGTYLYSVEAQDFRGGTALGSVHRTYALAVVPCEGVPDAVIKRDDAAVIAGVDSVSIVRCGGARTVQFENKSQGATGYWWDFGDPTTTADISTDANPSYTYPAAGRFNLTFVAYGPNCSDTLRTQVVLSDEAVPVADFTTDAEPLCAGRSYAFRSTDTDPTHKLAWRFVEPGGWKSSEAFSTPVIYEPDVPGLLAVTHLVATASGCFAVTERNISVEGGGVQVMRDTTVVKDTRLTLRASGGTSYQWVAIPPATLALNSGANPVVFTGYSDTGLQFVCISTGINGCRDYDTVTVTVTERAYAFVPTAFSPNGDGLNDRLRPRLSGANLYQFIVFNRYGQEVFRTSDPRTTGWDGTFGGQPLSAGTFHWMARMMPAGGGTVVESGDVTLVR